MRRFAATKAVSMELYSEIATPFSDSATTESSTELIPHATRMFSRIPTTSVLLNIEHSRHHDESRSGLCFQNEYGRATGSVASDNEKNDETIRLFQTTPNLFRFKEIFAQHAPWAHSDPHLGNDDSAALARLLFEFDDKIRSATQWRHPYWVPSTQASADRPSAC
jgi:hypothetical protein